MPDTRSTLTPAGHPGLMADILAHPRDVAPRLVFADWLEDHGQEDRAAFVREPFGAGPPHLHLHKQSRDHRRRMAFVKEGLAGVFPGSYRLYFDLACDDRLRGGTPLSEANAGVVWWPGPRDVALVVRYGFVTEVGLKESLFYRYAAALFRAQPVADVRLLLSAADGPDRPGAQFSTAWLQKRAGRRKLGAVDPRLFALFQGGERFRAYGYEGVNYPDRVAAWRALSDACVTWGRRAAGLPDLPPRV